MVPEGVHLARATSYCTLTGRSNSGLKNRLPRPFRQIRYVSTRELSLIDWVLDSADHLKSSWGKRLFITSFVLVAQGTQRRLHDSATLVGASCRGCLAKASPSAGDPILTLERHRLVSLAIHLAMSLV